MARQRAVAELPPIQEWNAGGKFFGTGLAFESELEILCRSLQREQAQRFYTMAEISRISGRRQATVQKGYQEMRRRGLLRPVWGSGTLLEGTLFGRSLSLRGWIVAPVSYPRHRTDHEYSIFVLSLLHYIRLQGFAANLHIYGSGQPGLPEMSAQFHHPFPDAVVWAMPPSSARSEIALLGDQGIPSVTVGATRLCEHSAHYHLDKKPALAAALRSAGERGVKRLLLPLRESGRSAETIREVTAAAAECGMPATTSLPDKKTPGHHLHSLTKSSGSLIAFPSAEYEVAACQQAPEAALRLIREGRLLCLNGVQWMDLGMRDPVALEAIRFDWKAVASRIASDLAGEKGRPVEDRRFTANYASACVVLGSHHRDSD